MFLIMCLHFRLNEGETVIRTIADYWIVARKNGHRRFFVLFTQKDVNFAEVNGNLIHFLSSHLTCPLFL